MNFGYTRPHSTDSWRSRRPPFELTSRMHSVPRNLKSTNRHPGVTYSSDFNFVESPLYYMHRNDPSGMNRDGPSSPHNSVRPFDRDEFNIKYPHKSYDKELQRKMIFNLHEEIEKPFLTTILEEICDPDRINDICLNTLTSMMRSKTYRKFLHHMNNNAIPSNQRSDITNNSKKFAKAATSRESTGNAEPNTSEMVTSKNVRIVPPPGSEKPNPNNLSMQFEDYRNQALINRKRRQDEINALEKLKMRLPPAKKRLRKKALKSTDGEETEEEEDQATMAEIIKEKSRFMHTILNIKPPPKEKPEEPEPEIPNPKLKKMTPEEILRTKWLRLTNSQIADLEAEIRASGKDPGIHHFSKVDVESIFRK